MKRAASSPLKRSSSGASNTNTFKRQKLSTTSPVKTNDGANSAASSGSKRTPRYKFFSWNVNGIKAFTKKPDSPLTTLLDDYTPHILCLQETKLQPVHEKKYNALHEDYITLFNSCRERNGYSGTALMIRRDFWKEQAEKFEMKLKISTGWNIPQRELDDSILHNEGPPAEEVSDVSEASDADEQGRIMTLELPHCFLVNSYVLNSGQKLEKLTKRTEEWEPKMRAYLNSLSAIKPVVFCGDLNCARKEIDLARPKTNKKTAGFTPQEREQFEKFFTECKLVDTYRKFNPDKKDAYTYWSYRRQCREKNLGWRLDYFLVSSDIEDKVNKSFILSSMHGSDHCPIGFELDVSTLAESV